MSKGVLLALPGSDSSASTRARCRTRTSTEEQAGDIYKMPDLSRSFNTQEDYWIELYNAKGNTAGEIDINDHGPSVRLFNGNDRPTAAIATSQFEPCIALSNPIGRECEHKPIPFRVTLGW